MADLRKEIEQEIERFLQDRYGESLWVVEEPGYDAATCPKGIYRTKEEALEEARSLITGENYVSIIKETSQGSSVMWGGEEGEEMPLLVMREISPKDFLKDVIWQEARLVERSGILD